MRLLRMVYLSITIEILAANFSYVMQPKPNFIKKNHVIDRK